MIGLIQTAAAYTNSASSVSAHRPAAASAGAQKPAAAPITTDTAEISGTGVQQAALEKSRQAWDRTTTATLNLPVDQRRELYQLWNQRVAEATDGKQLSEPQRKELKWSIIASTQAEWAEKRALENPTSDPKAARNLADLAYGSMDYLRLRNEYRMAGGPIGKP